MRRFVSSLSEIRCPSPYLCLADTPVVFGSWCCEAEKNAISRKKQPRLEKKKYIRKDKQYKYDIDIDKQRENLVIVAPHVRVLDFANV